MAFFCPPFCPPDDSLFSFDTLRIIELKKEKQIVSLIASNSKFLHRFMESQTKTPPVETAESQPTPTLTQNHSAESISDQDDLFEIAPAQHFDLKRGLAIITIPYPRSKAGYALVTSKRERIELDEAAVMRLGYSTDRAPHPKRRWSWNSLQRFLKQEIKGTLAKAFGEILKALEAHLDLGEYQNIETLGLWIIGTYMHRLFPAYPYIHLNGMAEAGKSKTLHLVSLMAFNARLGTETTPAALVRLTHDNQSTLCLDEIEKLQNAKDEMSQSALAILNSGYKRGASVTKMGAGRNDKDWVLKEFDPYSPKILAGIRTLEATLASRCISI
ncbi:MAG: hypothetical protein WC895_04550, partial [Candidatus Shapirobacteria bacterium]